MKIVNYYCDHCGKKMKMEDDVNLVEITFDPGYNPTIAHLCDNCVKDLKKFISNIDMKEVTAE